MVMGSSSSAAAISTVGRAGAGESSTYGRVARGSGGRRAAPHATACQELPQDDAGRIDVGPSIYDARARLFRRHVRGLALEEADSRLAAGIVGLRDAEVRQLDLAVVAHQYVSWRDVAVD